MMEIVKCILSVIFFHSTVYGMHYDPMYGLANHPHVVPSSYGHMSHAHQHSYHSYGYSETVDCVVSSWSSWSVPDANGKSTRTRFILVHPSPYGAQCPPDNEMIETKNVPIDCVVSEWSSWSSPNSETGKSTRTRTIQISPKCGGMPCPSLVEMKYVPIDCEVTSWGPWSKPNPKNGKTRRTRTIKVLPIRGGKSCPKLIEVKLVPVDCEVSEWGPWTTPNPVSGKTLRKRTIEIKPINGGKPCPPLTDTKFVPIDCQVSSWNEWATPDPITGKTNRSRTITTAPKNSGKPCPDLIETKYVPVNCTVSEWSAWSTPNPSSGKSMRNRTILVPPKNGGKSCPPLKESKTVKIDCQVSTWGEWSEAFGFGDQKRTRTIEVQPVGAGKKCPKLEEIRKGDVLPTPDKVAEQIGIEFVRPNPQFPRDIIFLMDSSGSITFSRFRRALNNLAKLSGFFCPQPDPFKPRNDNHFHQVATIQYSFDIEQVFDFNDHQTLKGVQDAIKSISYMQSTTCTEKAFDAAYDLIKSDNGGARPDNVTKKQVLLLTDGNYNCATEAKVLEAFQRLSQEAEIFGLMIGINDADGQEKLSKIVSKPLLNHLFAVKNFNDFNVLVNKLEDIIKNGKLPCRPFQNI